MDSNFLTTLSALCGFILAGIGSITLLKVPPKKVQIESASKILRKRICQDADLVKEELNEYFVSIIRHLTEANVCFYISFIVLSLTVESLNPGITIFGAMAKILPFALIPCVISMFAKRQVKMLQWEYLEKLDK